MEQHKHKRREVSAGPTPIDQLLASHYSRLLQWGTVLTRGDAGSSEEIVQELCLYFTLTQPDLTSVANLDVPNAPICRSFSSARCYRGR
jgi:hypothetical protein